MERTNWALTGRNCSHDRNDVSSVWLLGGTVCVLRAVSHSVLRWFFHLPPHPTPFPPPTHLLRWHKIGAHVHAPSKNCTYMHLYIILMKRFQRFKHLPQSVAHNGTHTHTQSSTYVGGTHPDHRNTQTHGGTHTQTNTHTHTHTHTPSAATIYRYSDIIIL